jgi:LysM repeat protein
MMKFVIINHSNLDISDIEPLIKSLMSFSQDELGFQRPPKLFLKSDIENSKNILGKTAFYDPMSHEITTFVDGRHPKDILRSISHELVHHNQNCRGEFDHEVVGGENYAQEDPHLRNMEKEAYLMGNIIFRDWEDGHKKQLRESNYYDSGYILEEKKQMSTKNWKDSELNTLLMEKWGYKSQVIEEKKGIKNPGKYIDGERAKVGLDDDGDGVPDKADKDPNDGAVQEGEHATGGDSDSVVVKKGDTLSAIAKDREVTVDDIMNHSRNKGKIESPDKIKVGQEIFIPQPGVGRKAATMKEQEMDMPDMPDIEIPEMPDMPDMDIEDLEVKAPAAMAEKQDDPVIAALVADDPDIAALDAIGTSKGWKQMGRQGRKLGKIRDRAAKKIDNIAARDRAKDFKQDRKDARRAGRARVKIARSGGAPPVAEAARNFPHLDELGESQDRLRKVIREAILKKLQK